MIEKVFLFHDFSKAPGIRLVCPTRCNDTFLEGIDAKKTKQSNMHGNGRAGKLNTFYALKDQLVRTYFDFRLKFIFNKSLIKQKWSTVSF